MKKNFPRLVDGADPVRSSIHITRGKGKLQGCYLVRRRSAVRFRIKSQMLRNRFVPLVQFRHYRSFDVPDMLRGVFKTFNTVKRVDNFG